MKPVASPVLLAVVLCAACAVPGRQREVAVLPTGDGSLLRFNASEVAVLDGKLQRLQGYANRAGGAPRASALELGERLAAVACSSAIAVTDLSGAAEPTWIQLAEPFPTRAMSIRQGRCALVGRGREAIVLQLPDGNITWRGKAGVHIDEAALVVATGPAEQVVVGRRGETVLVQRIDFARGDGQLTSETIVPRMNVIGAAATAGGAIFVAGLREETSASTRREMRQWFVIVRVDPGSFRVEELVYERCDALEAAITDLAVGQEMLAMSVWLYGRGTRLRVYDQVKDRRPANWSFDKGIEDGAAVAWLSPDFVAVVGAKAPPQLLQVTGDR